MKPTWSNKVESPQSIFPITTRLGWHVPRRRVTRHHVAIRGSCPDNLLGEPKLRKHVGMDDVVPTVKAKQIWREHTHNRKGVNIYCMFTSGEKKTWLNYSRVIWPCCGDNWMWIPPFHFDPQMYMWMVLGLLFNRSTSNIIFPLETYNLITSL